MLALRQLVVELGRRADRRMLVTTIVSLNLAWLLILAAFDNAFRRVAGVTLLDLQNSITPAEMISPSRALEQIASYPEDAKTLYWAFFILDDIMPPLAFGSLALLWVNLLHRRDARLPRWLLGSTAVLVPLGVGLFDWIENLAYLTAINGSSATATVAIWTGLTAKWIKAAFLQATMVTTVVVVAYAVARPIQRRLSPQRRTVQPESYAER